MKAGQRKLLLELLGVTRSLDRQLTALLGKIPAEDRQRKEWRDLVDAQELLRTKIAELAVYLEEQ